MQRVAPIVAVALVGACLSAPCLSTAEARCRRVELPEEIAQSAFVVEAEVIEAGGTARFRTRQIWKGDVVPATFTLPTRRGRGTWPWSDASSVGDRFLLFVGRSDDGSLWVGRCGSTGPATEAMRQELRRRGLRPRSAPRP